jgi:hypothetical protein
MTGWQKWITTAACVGTLLLGLYQINTITKSVDTICAQDGCRYTVWGQAPVLALYVVLATIGVGAILAWVFSISRE